MFLLPLIAEKTLFLICELLNFTRAKATLYYTCFSTNIPTYLKEDIYASVLIRLGFVLLAVTTFDLFLIFFAIFTFKNFMGKIYQTENIKKKFIILKTYKNNIICK
jgi:hypothetical protein